VLLVLDPGQPRAGQKDPQNLACGSSMPPQKRKRVSVPPFGQFLDVIKNRVVENRCFGWRFRLFVVTPPANEKFLLPLCCFRRRKYV